MPRKKRTDSGFGGRLATLRQARGLTQVQLAHAIGSTQRAVSYYENHGSHPPGDVVAALARGLSVSSDELLGLKSLPRARRAPETVSRRLRKRLQQLLALPEKDQRAILRLINSLVAGRGNGR